MKIGITSYALAWSRLKDPDSWGPRQMVEWAKANGAEVIQMCENCPVEDMAPGEFLDILDPGSCLIETGLRTLDPARHAKHVALAQAAGARVVRTVIDDKGFEPSLAEARRLAQELQPLYEGTGVSLAIENHDRFPSPDLLALVSDLGPWAGICLDTANSMAQPETPRQTTEILAPRTLSIHAKDVVVKRLSHMMGFTIEGVPLGEGVVDLPSLVALGRATGSNILVEQWPPSPAPEDGGKWEREAVALGLARLKEAAALQP